MCSTYPHPVACFRSPSFRCEWSTIHHARFLSSTISEARTSAACSKSDFAGGDSNDDSDEDIVVVVVVVDHGV